MALNIFSFLPKALEESYRVQNVLSNLVAKLLILADDIFRATT